MMGALGLHWYIKNNMLLKYSKHIKLYAIYDFRYEMKISVENKFETNNKLISEYQIN